MRYGIYDKIKVKNGNVVFCNNCMNYYYEDITDERNVNSLQFYKIDNKDKEQTIKGCPFCLTDNYLENT